MKSITVTDYNKKKDKYTLLDVRELNEVAFAQINPHTNIPMGIIPVKYEELNKESPIVIMCHTGVRSAAVCRFLEPLGYDVTNLEGGINAWSQQVDLAVPR
ncbi:MAG: sulfurtransferase [Candidatus Marinimicrobia bacterium]|nr:sulfurtransferase [Candidatus Neomarinimicrobiota bacterium]MBL7031525.1 sulfurtransferase [Candidatus Neomarinimicrobiota bacterium]